MSSGVGRWCAKNDKAQGVLICFIVADDEEGRVDGRSACSHDLSRASCWEWLKTRSESRMRSNRLWGGKQSSSGWMDEPHVKPCKIQQ